MLRRYPLWGRGRISYILNSPSDLRLTPGGPLGRERERERGRDKERREWKGIKQREKKEGARKEKGEVI